MKEGRRVQSGLTLVTAVAVVAVWWVDRNRVLGPQREAQLPEVGLFLVVVHHNRVTERPFSCHFFFLSPSLSFLLPYPSLPCSLHALPLPPSFLSLPPFLPHSLPTSLTHFSSLSHLLPISFPPFPHLTHSPPPSLPPSLPPPTSLTLHLPPSSFLSLPPSPSLSLPPLPPLPQDSSSPGNGAPPPPPGFTAKGQDSSGPNTLSNSVNHSLWANATGQGRPKYSTCAITPALCNIVCFSIF